ncbi:MAG TPA: hypothetical protein VGB49_02655 [Caulobacteraceae bacterium]
MSGLFARRPAVIVGSVAAAALVVMGLTAAHVRSTSQPGGPGGPGLGIELFTPPEPPIRAGATMDVGELEDGFDPAAMRNARREEPLWEEPQYEPEASAAYGQAEPVRTERIVIPDSPDSREEVRRQFSGDPYAFGYDVPQPDWRREREERRARMERAERARYADHRDEDRWAPFDPRREDEAAEGDEYVEDDEGFTE